MYTLGTNMHMPLYLKIAVLWPGGGCGMKMPSVRVLVLLLVVALPVCWAQVFPDDALANNIESLASVPDTAKLLLFGTTLLALSSYMRIRGVR
jgi:hypothetical protein